jgi:nitrate reductase gamma subunit
LIVLVRHLRLLLEPVPAVVVLVQQVDGFLQIGLPVLFMTTAGFTLGILYLTYRRLADPGVRYLSLAADYFPLFLLLGIAVTGILMRHFVKTDVVGIKALMVGLATFHPEAPAAPAMLFLMHLTMVSTLLAYFPASKLMHMAGVFMSPTRNLANSNRWERHVNPWNPEVKTHSYAEWEEEFHDKLAAAGIPLDGAPAAPSTSPGSK